MAASRAGDTPAARLVAVWQEIGAKAEIPQECLAEVSTILLDTLPLVRKQPDEAFLRRFRESLPEFVKAHVGYLNGPRRCEGAGRWLAFCVAEALNRDPLTPEEERECEAEYRALYEGFAQFAEKRIRKGIPEPVPEKVDQAIKAGMATWLDEVTERTRRLQRDPLFPCLRAPLTKDALESLTKHFQSDLALPRWDDPLFPALARYGHRGNTRAPAPEEAQADGLILQMRSFVSDSVGNVLFHLATDEISPQLRPCRYWGYVSFDASGGGGGSGWPVAVTLGLNEELNTHKGWMGPLQP
ncbi:MAG: hypothetical protein EOM52_12615 [Clostridia bacterium]|nr:hypothetical protein [Clostridia bacterium]